MPKDLAHVRDIEYVVLTYSIQHHKSCYKLKFHPLKVIELLEMAACVQVVMNDSIFAWSENDTESETSDMQDLYFVDLTGRRSS